MRNRKSGERSWVILGAVVAFVSGCDILDSGKGLIIGLPEQKMAFSVDLGQVKSSMQTALDAIADAQSVPRVDLSAVETFPAGFPPIQQTFPLDLPAQVFDMSDQQQIKTYIDQGMVRQVIVRDVTYRLTANSVNYDLPELEIYIDGILAKKISDTSSLIAAVPTVTQKSTPAGSVLFAEGGQAKLGEYLLKLQFAFLGKTSVSIDTAANPTIPAGVLTGEVVVVADIEADPL